MATICVLGLGYIGFPTSLLLAANGHIVIGVDINQKVLDSLNSGVPHIMEPGLNELFEEGRSRFSAQGTVPEADVYLIAVPTPLDTHLRISDLRYVRSAATMIFPHLKKGNLVILESTVPPRASERVIIPILEKSGLKAGEFLYAHCPERAIPGNTLHEMMYNDRIIGGVTQESIIAAEKIYSSYVRGKIYTTDAKTAEFVKLVENTFRDVNIALANELAQIAEDYGINIWDVTELANRHPRVNLLKPGPGVGGHCIAVDPWFLTENSTNTGMIQLSRDINETMPNYVIQHVRSILKGVREPVITVFGVSYKGNIDDCRETPALKFIQLALNEGYQVKCFDPLVKEFAYDLSPMHEALEGSDCIILITDHDQFKEIDPATLLMRRKNIVDTRNLLDHQRWRSAGYYVKLMGDGREQFLDHSLLERVSSEERP
ncbi:UDP-N-acetyl-D-mannosamine dehydrogenase [Methanocalculus chunghsingensis]|uniref:UDP-N-acetyl-D-mannosamine dehydrogenase n=1 Tax=Methanocalculus chunghsingensis TaxID=156457 RepID=A0A8J8B421_9EURY|nr:nucleotide sugar dehydrogenase [Methanocalculus chunghsingensis]MBR1368261.1 UDP-N-acetyl-D-mannosamine dehydrogenase [Methanocalculus chunghsingensis]